MRGTRIDAMRAVHSLIIPAVIAFALALPSCKREERGFRVSPPNAQTAEMVRVVAR